MTPAGRIRPARAPAPAEPLVLGGIDVSRGGADILVRGFFLGRQECPPHHRSYHLRAPEPRIPRLLAPVAALTRRKPDGLRSPTGTGTGPLGKTPSGFFEPPPAEGRSGCPAPHRIRAPHLSAFGSLSQAPRARSISEIQVIQNTPADHSYISDIEAVRACVALRRSTSLSRTFCLAALRIDKPQRRGTRPSAHMPNCQRTGARAPSGLFGQDPGDRRATERRAPQHRKAAHTRRDPQRHDVRPLLRSDKPELRRACPSLAGIAGFTSPVANERRTANSRLQV